MAPKWSERPRPMRFAIVGAFASIAVAAWVAFNYAFESETIVRYFTMVAVLLGGGSAGFGPAVLTAKR